MKNLYFLWFEYYKSLPKTHRYTLGQKIDSIFIEAIESTTTASFLPKDNKLPFLTHAIRKIDTNKILLMVLWENKSLNDKKYITLSEKITEMGKMLGGWRGQILKQAKK